METRSLGTRGPVVSSLGFGCGPSAKLMVGTDEKLQTATVKLALDSGITLFDTAASYGGGASERNLGRALRRCSRSAITITTKVLVTVDDLGDVRGAVLRSVAASLARLEMDAVDILVLHNRVSWARRQPRTIVGIGPLLSVDDVLGDKGLAGALDELKRSGTIRAAGFTAYGGEQSAVDELLASGTFEAMNAEYSVGNPSAGLALSPSGLADYRSVIPRANSAGVGTMIIRALAGAKAFSTADERRETSPLLAALETWYQDIECSPYEAALRFALSHSGASTVILGFSEPSHVEDAVRAAERGPLSAAQLSGYRRSAARSDVG